MPDIVYLDLETTGVESRRHTIFEMGLIFSQKNSVTDIDNQLKIWIVPNDEELRDADANAMRVNRYNEIFWQRESEGRGPGTMVISDHKRRTLAAQLAKWTDGVLFAGCNVKFDQEFLEAWMRRYGACPTWDYHVLDVPTYAAGVWNAGARHIKKGESKPAIPPPFKTYKLADAFGVSEPTEAHTALGDAQWGKQLYEAAVSKTQ